MFKCTVAISQANGNQQHDDNYFADRKKNMGSNTKNEILRMNACKNNNNDNC